MGEQSAVGKIPAEFPHILSEYSVSLIFDPFGNGKYE